MFPDLSLGDTFASGSAAFGSEDLWRGSPPWIVVVESVRDLLCFWLILRGVFLDHDHVEFGSLFSGL